MTIAEILESVQFVVDREGKQTGVMFTLPAWETLRPLLEEVMEDARLGQLMAEVEDDERLEGDDAHQAYQSYLSQL